MLVLLVLGSASALPEEVAESLIAPVPDSPQSTPDEWDASATGEAIVLQPAELDAALAVIHPLESFKVLANASQIVEESFMRADFKVPSEQRLDLVGLAGPHGVRLLLSVATKSNVGTGLVKSIALHRAARAAAGATPMRLMQVMQLYGEGAEEILECERGHAVSLEGVAQLREALELAGVRELPTTDAVLLAVLAHAALRQLPGRAQASGSLPAARAQLLRDRYDALAVLRAVQAQVFTGSCDDDEAAKFFSRDDTVIEGVQLGAFDAGHTGHGEVAAALRGFLSGAGLKQEL